MVTKSISFESDSFILDSKGIKQLRLFDGYILCSFDMREKYINLKSKKYKNEDYIYRCIGLIYD